VQFGAILFVVQRVGVILVRRGAVCFALAMCGAVLSPRFKIKKKLKKKEGRKPYFG
jgi:hypothetical protein